MKYWLMAFEHTGRQMVARTRTGHLEVMMSDGTFAHAGEISEPFTMTELHTPERGKSDWWRSHIAARGNEPTFPEYVESINRPYT